uniref:Peptidase S24/S26A/S26B/S26C domain-containing protein n=1 Tax=termite gut metagenome TaxID=433724 RepID=S0DF72_9ZZZZ
MNNWQRIERVVKWTGLSVNSFALSIGLSRGENLYQIKRGNNGISRELAGMIAAKYPQISRAWLLAGEGDMFTDETARRTSVPFYDVDIEKYVAEPGKFSSRSYVSIPTIEDADFGAVYHGRAMGESVPAGSMLLVRRIPPESLVPGGDYLIITKDVTILRRVRRESGSDVLRLLPVDTTNFDEIRIDTADVRELYIVRAVVINKTI